MKKVTTLFVVVLLLSLVRGGSPQDLSWETVRERMLAGDSYSLLCDYIGPEGEFYFRYTVLAQGSQIFTEVLEGSSRGAGTKVFYDRAKDADNVTMQTSLFRLRRSLQARDIQDTPLYQPLFAHLLDQFCQPEPNSIEASDKNGTLFHFGDETTVYDCLEVDRHGNPLGISRMEDGKVVNRLTFHQLEWGDREIDWEH